MVALYAIYMKTQVEDLRNSVKTTLDFVNSSIKGGGLKGTDLTDAKQVAVDLKNALHALGQ